MLVKEARASISSPQAPLGSETFFRWPSFSTTRQTHPAITSKTRTHGFEIGAEPGRAAQLAERERKHDEKAPNHTTHTTRMRAPRNHSNHSANAEFKTTHGLRNRNWISVARVFAWPLRLVSRCRLSLIAVDQVVMCRLDRNFTLMSLNSTIQLEANVKSIKSWLVI